MLGSILTKLLIDRPIIEWAEKLPSALWACRIRSHNYTSMSPFKLMYGLEPRLTGDQEEFDQDNLDADVGLRIEKMLTNRAIANRKLIERGIYAKKLCIDRLH